MSSFTPHIKRVTKQTGKSSMKIAFELIKENRYDEAVSAFEAIIEKEPDSKQAHLAIGNIYLKQKDYDKALTHFQMARKLDPMLVQSSLGVGNVYYEQKQLELAIRAFQDAINIDFKNPAGYLGMGRSLLKQKKYAQAKEQVEKALILNPQLIQGRLIVAQIYQQQGNLEEAITEIKSALKINPTVWIAYQSLGNIYLRQKKYNLSRKNFEEAQQLNPQLPVVAKMGYIEALIEDNALNEAREILKKMPNKEPIEARKQKLLGDVYSRQGLLKEATESYRAANILAAEEGEISSELSDLDLLLDEDETKLEEVLEAYKKKANQRIEKRIEQAQLRNNS